MPGRNIYKDYVADSYYHIYNRGNNQDIFCDEEDYIVFLSLFKRYLGKKQSKKKSGVLHPSYRNEIKLLAFCLMPSHFHLFVYQHIETAITTFLKSLSVSYAMYYNKKYNRIGPVFQQRYRASRISDDSYLLHISRYLHLNPDNYKTWQWSSLPYYNGRLKADWLRPEQVLELFDGDEYGEFLEDYVDSKRELEVIKHELADQI